MTHLILAATQEVRSWPFYGKAVEIVEKLAAVSHPGDELRAFDMAVEHRARVEADLENARRIVRLLEHDLAVLDEHWPSEARRK